MTPVLEKIGVVCFAILGACSIGGTEPMADAAPGADAAVCNPDAVSCDGDTIVRCREDGSGHEAIATCDPTAGTFCSPGRSTCDDPCGLATAARSYVGCEYWAVILPNATSRGERVGLVMSNASAYPAHVVVEQGDELVGELDLAPSALGQLRLPRRERDPIHMYSSRTFETGYRLRSTVPLTVYQINPLEDDASDARPSYTSDGSLLLPVHSLGDEYLVLGWRSGMNAKGGRDPGIVSVVAAERTRVEIAPTADILGSLDGVMQPIAEGATASFDLEAGEVLELVASTPETCGSFVPEETGDPSVSFCDLGLAYDLTGTRVRATGRVAVFSAARCAHVPFNRMACDHLEEMLPPLSSFGRDVIVPLARASEEHDVIVRILAAHGDTTLAFEPAIHEPSTLAAGEFVELVPSSSFRVSATGPILVAQFLTGQGSNAPLFDYSDPSFGIQSPVEQFRSQYRFISPRTYPHHWVNVVGPAGVALRIDGEEVDATLLTPIGTTGFVEARIPLAGGVHTLHADQPVGATAYGFADYTSYLYPAGLDVRDLLL